MYDSMAAHLAMTTLSESQVEIPSIITRFKMSDAATSQVAYDDVGGLAITIVGTPTRELPGMSRGDAAAFCSAGSVGNLWSANLTSWVLAGGLSVEAIVCAEPNGNGFSVIKAPGQFKLNVEAGNVVWSVNTSTENTLTKTSVLKGFPQHIVGVYDIVAGMQRIYVDGVLVASTAITGAIAATLTGPGALLAPVSAAVTQAVGQNIAVYGAALSAARVKQHFDNFRQVLSDPGHVRISAGIGVGS